MVKVKSNQLVMLTEAVKNAIKIKEAFLYEQNSEFQAKNLNSKYVLEIFGKVYFLESNGMVTLLPDMTQKIEYSKDGIVELED